MTFGENITVTAKCGDTEGTLTIGELSFPCRLGRSGIIDAADKREGDGATPLGTYPLRKVLYRPDRLVPPETELPCLSMSPRMGWCDDPADPAYNQMVVLPYAASHENMWEVGDPYNIVVVIGFNDNPSVPGMGSAIFLHLEKPEKTPTAGCVALSLEDMLAVLPLLDFDSTITISES